MAATDDHPGTTGANATLLIDAPPLPGVIETAYDTDRFRVELSVGQYYRFTLTATVAGSLAKQQLVLRASNGAILATDTAGSKGGGTVFDFTPAASGVYYIDAIGDTDTGAYTLTATTRFDQFSNDIHTMGRMTVGSDPLDSLLDAEGDVDWVAVPLTAGETYRFTLTAAPGGMTHPRLELVGEGIAARGGSKGNTAQLTYTASRSGTYYLAVSSELATAGPYQLSATAAMDDFAGATTTAGTVLVDAAQPTSGRIESAGDSDYFRLSLTAGQYYAFDLRGTGTGTAALDTVLRLRDAQGLVVAENDNAGAADGASGLLFSPDTSGTYFLDASAKTSATGTYQLRAALDDFPDDGTTRGQVVMNGPAATGFIQSGNDADRFKLVLEPNQGVRLGFTHVPSSELAPQLSVYKSDGTLLGPGEPGRLLQQGGTFYVSVSSWNGSTGAYALSARNAWGDDFAGDAGTDGYVVVDGDPQAGLLEASGDTDAFRVELVAGKPYMFDVRQHGGRNGLSDTHLRLRDAEGTVLAANDDWHAQASSRIAFTPASSGSYYLEVSSDTGRTGSYVVSAISDDHWGGPETTTVITAGDPPRAGTIERPDDADWFAIDLNADALYEFMLAGAGPNALASPVLQLHDANGALAAGMQMAAGRISYLAEATGRYYLSAADAGRTATGGYLLTAAQLPDDVAGTPATRAMVRVNGGASGGTIEGPDDVDCFRVELVGGTQYVFSAASADASGSATGPNLQLRAADGKPLGSGSKGQGTDLRHTVDQSGTYYVAVSGDLGHTGSYLLAASTVPLLQGTSPADGARGVARSANLVVNFSEPVAPGSGSIHLVDAAGTIVRSFDVSDASQVVFNGKVLTIDPATDMPGGTALSVRIDPGAVRSLHGVAVAEEAATAFDFSTLAGNRNPTGAPAQLSATEGTAASGRLPAAADADGDSITYHLEDAAMHGHVTVGTDGRYTYEPAAGFSGADSFRFSVQDSQGGFTAYTAAVKVAALPTVNGTDRDDTLQGGAAAERHQGRAGNDRITPAGGNDVVDGGLGTDTVVLTGQRTAASLQQQQDGQWTVTTVAGGTDKLRAVERLQFSDRSIALDLDGAGGLVARVIGAVFGPAQVHDAALVGRYLALADAGTEGEQLVAHALADPLFATLAGSRSNADVVGHVYANVVGQPADAAERDYFSGLIADGAYTQASLLWVACGLDLTAQRIDLAGMAAQGLDFLPPAG